MICLHCYQGDIKLNVLIFFYMAHLTYKCPNDNDCLCLLTSCPEKQKFILNMHTFKNDNECFLCLFKNIKRIQLLNCNPTSVYETSEQPTVERCTLQSTEAQCYALSFTCLYWAQHSSVFVALFNMWDSMRGQWECVKIPTSKDIVLTMQSNVCMSVWFYG